MTAQKVLYDGMFYQDQPSLIRRGLRPIRRAAKCGG
jgi:hypothetical protein